MNNFVKLLLIALFGAAAGYQLYPIVNATSLDSSQHGTTEQSENHKKAQTTVSESANNQLAHANKAPSSVEKMSNESQSAKAQSTDLAISPQNQNSGEELLTEDSYAVQELQQWSIEHKEKLNQMIDSNMPSSISSSMKSSISRNNQMLNDMPLQQDHAVDADWAYLMEQDIRAYIAQHELSPSFDLLNVSCKQLTCDVMGIENEAGIWFQIYRGFYSFKNIKFPNEGSKPVNVSRMDNGITYIYAQIMFKPSSNS
ncbi:hypothetical protein tloyanaT_07540 [Thalassotalea loyana]|uniref:Uncharacterized protein n=1 Tax=Thalassotalea loyana TaxID=280483 RepID=A0ABQ6HA65_9GAMM|nr:hypothetical protein [Thalassotalea loyana]GLX84502.1 hypothetical protein tloyanaT_07540 [Thalassotalea loyana]